MRLTQLLFVSLFLLATCGCGGDDEPQPEVPAQPVQTDGSAGADDDNTGGNTDDGGGAAAEEPTEEPAPADRQRSPEAERLLSYLNAINGRQFLSGTMACVNWNTSEAQWVYQHTGRWPAINCFDFIHHVWSTKGGWIDYTNTDVVEAWHAAGGIVAAMWHWNVPAKTAGSYAFYASDTNFDVRKITDTSSSEYRQMVSDIDQIAAYLKLLKDKHIPVIWRPLHEAGGQWFWWGRDAEACKQLWQLMFERFEAAGLDNLLWAWTPASAWNQPLTEGMKWYPGDAYVDIVGYDVYNVSSAQSCYADYYRFLAQQCPGKLIALTECGNVATLGSQWTAGAKWLFAMPWYDYDRTNNPSSPAFLSTDHGNADVGWWQEAWANDFVLSRDQVAY